MVLFKTYYKAKVGTLHYIVPYLTNICANAPFYEKGYDRQIHVTQFERWLFENLENFKLLYNPINQSDNDIKSYKNFHFLISAYMDAF